MKTQEIKEIMAKHWKEKENYNGEITVNVLEHHDNRTHFHVETVGNDYEVCAYNDGAIFIRLGGVTAGAGSWATLDGKPALIMDDVPFTRKLLKYPTFKNVGGWWNNRDIELIKFNDGHMHAGQVFALHGWNGEEYVKCWECVGDRNMDASEEEYCLKPIHRFELENVDLDSVEENSDEWNRQCEFVDFKIEY